MGRQPIRTLAAVALGVATTFVVAWALAMHIIDDRTGARTAYRAAGSAAFPLAVFRYDRTGTTEFRAHSGAVFSDMAPPFATVDDLTPVWARPLLVAGAWEGTPGDQNPGFLDRTLIIRGWPWPCLWCQLEGVPNGAGYWGHRALSGFVPNPQWQGFGRHWPGDPPVTLPYRPRCGPFLANAGVYSTAWWLVLAVPGVARRALRRKQSRCTGCGYDLRGLPADSRCPECGGEG